MFKICILLAVGVDQLVQVASIDQTVPGRELADSVEPHILQPQIIQTEYVEMNGPAVCPQGERSMNKQCDAKRPWPQCPPQSYCYATGAVDLGPYWCCGAVGSSGAGFRPQAPFYSIDPFNPQAANIPMAPITPEINLRSSFVPGNAKFQEEQMKSSRIADARPIIRQPIGYPPLPQQPQIYNPAAQQPVQQQTNYAPYGQQVVQYPPVDGAFTNQAIGPIPPPEYNPGQATPLYQGPQQNYNPAGGASSWFVSNSNQQQQANVGRWWNNHGPSKHEQATAAPAVWPQEAPQWGHVIQQGKQRTASKLHKLLIRK